MFDPGVDVFDVEIQGVQLRVVVGGLDVGDEEDELALIPEIPSIVKSCRVLKIAGSFPCRYESCKSLMVSLRDRGVLFQEVGDDGTEVG